MKIWKYEVSARNLTGIWTIAMPKGAKPVAAGMQDSGAYIWALVDETLAAEDTEPRTFVICGTGWRILYERIEYIGILFDPPYVWHVLEVLE